MLYNSTDACAVSQSLLDRTGHAILTGDLKSYLPCFTIPHTIHTFEGRQEIADTATLTRVFHDVRAFFNDLGVTMLARRCTQALMLGPDRITAHYESRVINGTQLVMRPIPSLAELHLVDGEWRVGNCQYGIADAHRLVAALLQTPLARPDL